MAPIHGNPDVIEICCNRPGEVWVEAISKLALERFELPSLIPEVVQRLAEHVASVTKQSVNEETPLLSAAMPHAQDQKQQTRQLGSAAKGRERSGRLHAA